MLENNINRVGKDIELLINVTKATCMVISRLNHQQAVFRVDEKQVE